MAETAHLAWYRQGLVSVTNGSTKVSGNGTKFLTAGINAGASLRLDARGDYALEIDRVVSDTEIQLVKPYVGQSATNQAYSIDRNHQSTLPADLSARLARAMGNWEARYDLDMQTITGPSAYEVAVENGYTGTKAQWLESLKATDEFRALKNLVDPLLIHNAGAHNAMYRGKNLGVFSDAQSAAIRAGTFGGTYGGVYADVYPGDHWVFSNIPYSYLDENNETKSSTYSGTMRVADLDYYLKAGDQGDGLTAHHIVVVPDTNMFTAPMNAENTTEGGYVGSKMRTVYLRRAEAIFKACFGENHVLKHREYLVNAVANGKASAGAWCDSFVDLMDERMVYGAPIFDSASTDGGDTIPSRYSVSCKQLNLFRHRPDMISNRQWYWLRNVVSAAFFAYVHSLGACAYSAASFSGGGVRPAALLY
ncbi:MAG: hypothetical protein IJQ15_11590 [Synergistaceae bacterium]|nr:hypothetical protein [Synergistaceae bacterium]